MSGIRVDQNILNQRATPAFYAANYFDRPAAGFVGRVFISINTYQIFRDEGTGWSLIADTGSGSSNLEQVTTNGNTTTIGIYVIGSGTLSVQSLTNGSVLFPSGGSGQISQDNANFFWDNTNKRLGLGTATPGARLDIHSGTGTTATFNGTGVTNAVTSYQSAGTSKWSIGNYVSSAVANDFCIYGNVNTAYRFYVHNTGVINIPTSLIIGSTTPTTSYSLDVTGSGNFTSSLLVGSNITASAFIPSGATVPTNGMYLSAANTLAFSANSTNKLSISSSGLASFNYNTSGTALKITTSYASGRVANFGFGDGSILPTAAFYIGNQTGVGVFIGDETFSTKGLYVTSGGNTTIGTTTDAGQKFQVSSNSSVYAAYIENGGSGSGLWVTSSGSAGTSNILRLRSTGVDRLLVNDLGNVLIGNTTDNGFRLQVTGSTGATYIGNAVKTEGSDSAYIYQNRSSSTYYSLYAVGGVSYFNNVNTSTNIAQINTTTGVYTPLSNINEKKDFELCTIGLDAILKLKPTLFRMKTENNTNKHLGFIAQEVKEFIPQAYVENDNFIGLSDRPIIAVLVKALQELNEKLVRNNIN